MSVYELAARLSAWWAQVKNPRTVDRGDNPVATAIITALLAILAAGMLKLFTDVADGWTARIPKGP